MAEVSIIPIRINDEPGMEAMTGFLAEQQERLWYPPGCIRLLAGVAIEGHREDGPYQPDEEGPIIGVFTMGLARAYWRDLTDNEVKKSLRVKIGRVVTRPESPIETITAIGDFAAIHRLVTIADEKDLSFVRPDLQNVTSIREARRMTVEPPEEELHIVQPKGIVTPGLVGALHPHLEA